MGEGGAIGAAAEEEGEEGFEQGAVVPRWERSL